jgi:4-hydroxybenzoate polyprenyltransferase
MIAVKNTGSFFIKKFFLFLSGQWQCMIDNKNRNNDLNMNLKEAVQLIRPHQWTKNFFIFLPLFFNANIRNPDQLWLCCCAFAGFSMITGAIYCINDIIDRKEDRMHPEKKERPLAKGSISVPTAIGLATFLFAVGLCIPLFTGLGSGVILITLLYAAVNIAYAFKLKQWAIIDVMCIAMGFVLRVIIGGFAADVALSHWIVLMTFLLAFFLACAKRRDDVLYYQEEGVATRKNVIHYNVEFLNAMMLITATITIISYIMYTVDKDVVEQFHNKPFIYITSLFVMLAIFRYLQIIMVKKSSGNPSKIILKDRFIQLCIAGWIVMFIFIIYV